MTARLCLTVWLIVCASAWLASAAERTTLAIRYQEGKTTEVRLDGTAASPHVRGKAKVEAKRGTAAIEVELDDVPPASTFGPYYATYVLWGITSEGQTNNLGELPWKGDMKLLASLPVQRFGLLVTAEPYAAVAQPSPRVVAENRLKPGESVASTGELTYQGDDGSLYSGDPALEIPFDSKTPTPIAAARLSVRVAERPTPPLTRVASWHRPPRSWRRWKPRTGRSRRTKARGAASRARRRGWPRPHG